MIKKRMKECLCYHILVHYRAGINTNIQGLNINLDGSNYHYDYIPLTKKYSKFIMLKDYLIYGIYYG